MPQEKIILEPNEDGVYTYNPSSWKSQKAAAKQFFKSAPRILINLCVLAALTLLLLTFVKGGVWMAREVYPGLIFGAKAVLLGMLILFIPLSMFRRTRAVAGLGIFALSYLLGLTLWVWSLILTFKLWGIFAVILGLFFVGVGIVPIALLAVLFHGDWATLGDLLLLIICVPVSRSFGLYLAAQAARLRNSSAHF